MFRKLCALRVTGTRFYVSDHGLRKYSEELEFLDQVPKFPHVGKFMHLPHPVHSLPVYTAPYIYIPGLPLQCTLPFFNALPAEIRTRNHGICSNVLKNKLDK